MPELPMMRCCSRLLVVGLAGMLLAGSPARAADTAGEHVVRAALLFNFLKFTEWPAGALGQTHLQICVASGDVELLEAIGKLNARQLHGHTLLVTRYRPQTACDALYVDGRQRWTELSGRGAAVLTVADFRGFAEEGGMIEISLHEGASRFVINLAEARRAGLRFYPQMLKLARRVIE